MFCFCIFMQQVSAENFLWAMGCIRCLIHVEKKREKYGPCPHEAPSLGKEMSVQDTIPHHDQPNEGSSGVPRRACYFRPGIRNASLGGTFLSPNLKDEQGLVENGEEKVPDQEHHG